MASSSAADPQAGTDNPAGSLVDAAARLEAALAWLEALVQAGPLQSDLFRAGAPAAAEGDQAPAMATDALVTELAAARKRETEFEAAAAAASEALCRAMVQVRDVLEAGDRRRGAGA